MDEILDDNLPRENRIVTYGGFWPRFGALFIDGIAVGVPLSIVTYYNVVSFKNIPLFIVLTLLNIAYKPLMEAQFGATLGKMAVNLKVVNLEFNKINFNEALMRNIFGIASGSISLFLGIGIFNKPEFNEVDGFMKYSQLLSGDGRSSLVSTLTFVIFLVEFIMLVSDDRKRSLHDRIANTFVIEK